jgi:hypothetical protein
MNDDQGRLGADRFGLNDDRLIQLLVDGELDGAERRALIERLDRRPDGWRHCAIAFLESQVWRDAMSMEQSDVAAAPASAGSTDGVGVVRELGRRRRSPARWSVPALAATIVLAFGLGWSACQMLGRTNAGLHAITPPQAEDIASTEPAPDESPDTSAPTAADAPAVRVVGLLTWTVSQDGGRQAVSVPIVEGDAIDEEWLMSQPVSVPESLLREVERQGHKLVASRRLVPIELEDGRRAGSRLTQNTRLDNISDAGGSRRSAACRPRVPIICTSGFSLTARR